MDWFKTVNDFYNTIDSDGNRIYDKSKVAVFVAKGKITPEQYAQITGETYNP